MLTTFPFTGDRRQILAIALIALLILGAAALGYMVWSRRQEEKDEDEKAALDAEDEADAEEDEDEDETDE